MGYSLQGIESTDQNNFYSARVTGWMLAPPVTGDYSGIVVRLVNELLALLSDYGAGMAFYSPFFQGYPQPTLQEALSQEIVEIIDIHDYSSSASKNSASVHISPGLPRESINVFCLSCFIQPGNSHQILETANDLAHFFKRCFTELNGDSAFISMSTMSPSRIVNGDNPAATTLEIDRQVKLANDDLWHRFVRGVFWGNGLSSELCDRLGGQATVLRDAPVFRAEPAAKGVWLQLSKSFPPKTEEIDRLKTYLSPLLGW